MVFAVHYSFLDPKEPSDIPPRQVNGGLFTGEAFQHGAPWGNIPVVPEADIYVTQNLQRANPPPPHMAFAAIPGETRPGNNAQALPPYKPFDPTKYAYLQCVFP
jgi:hypothetical protein